MLRFRVRVVAVALFGLSSACSDDAAEEPRIRAPNARPDASAPAVPRADAGAEAGAQATHAPPEALRRCAAGARAIVSTIDAVARLGELVPASGPCFVAALPRPLAVSATRGTISAQPADGDASPRLFFLLPGLVVSAVPSGPGSHVLEFGEWVSASRTIKGEIDLPVTQALPPGAAFAKVADGRGAGTSCRLCHRNEEPHASLPGAFVSAAFQPEPGEVLALAPIVKLHDACVRDDDASERCAMLHAVFDFGIVTQGAFGTEVATFVSR